MSTVTNVERKCDSCGTWVEGQHRLCPVCGEHMDHKVLQEEEIETAKEEKKVQDHAEFMAKPPLQRTLIRIGDKVETIFISIVGFISAVLFWIGG